MAFAAQRHHAGSRSIPDRSSHAAPTRYVCPETAPIGGTLRQRPSDFFVEEIPAYEPGGEGEHLYLLIEKTGLTTLDLTRIVAGYFGVRQRDVGYAGLKDKNAVTRQMISVRLPGARSREVTPPEHDRFRVLWMDWHTNKLRPGHLKGNRFQIMIRDAEPHRAPHALRVLDTLARTGLPNRVGQQRFGYLGVNHLIGRAIMLGEHSEALDLLLGPSRCHPEVQAEARQAYARGDLTTAIDAFPRTAHAERGALRWLLRGRGPEDALGRMDPRARGFYVSAFQSAIFNIVLDARLDRWDLNTLVRGDLAFRHDNGACFAVEADSALDPDLARRLDSLQISPSGPMWSARMTRAAGTVDLMECDALEAFGVGLDDLEVWGRREPHPMEGARRPMRVPLTEQEVDAGADEHGPYIRCRFTLPRGAFATTVMQEIIKPDQPESN